MNVVVAQGIRALLRRLPFAHEPPLAASCHCPCGGRMTRTDWCGALDDTGSRMRKGSLCTRCQPLSLLLGDLLRRQAPYRSSLNPRGYGGLPARLSSENLFLADRVSDPHLASETEYSTTSRTASSCEILSKIIVRPGKRFSRSIRTSALLAPIRTETTPSSLLATSTLPKSDAPVAYRNVSGSFFLFFCGRLDLISNPFQLNRGALNCGLSAVTPIVEANLSSNPSDSQSVSFEH